MLATESASRSWESLKKFPPQSNLEHKLEKLKMPQHQLGNIGLILHQVLEA